MRARLAYDEAIRLDPTYTSVVNWITPPEQTAQSGSVSFSGTGQQVSPFFTLEPGLAIFKMRHDGKGNFIVMLMDSSGSVVLSFLANEIGTFDGSKAMSIQEGGTYILDIKAGGDWKIDISQ
jgi:hypothetical protein